MRKEVVLVCFFMMICFVVASVSVEQYNVEDKDYHYGDIVSGNVTLKILDEDPNLYIGSSQDDSMTLLSFLQANSAPYTCVPASCEFGYYTIDGTKSLERNFDMYAGDDEQVGFYINGSEIALKSFSFNLSSNFHESFVMPLKINFFGKYNWTFTEFSDSFFSSDNYSCYNPENYVSYEYINSSQKYCSGFSIPDTGKIIAGFYRNGVDTNTVEVKVSLYTDSGKYVKSCSVFNNDKECNLTLGIDEYFSAGNYFVCISSTGAFSNYTIRENVGNCGFIDTANTFDGEKNKAFGIYIKYSGYADASKLNFKDDIIKYANMYMSDIYRSNCSNGCVLPVTFYSNISQELKLDNISIKYTSNGFENSSDSVFFIAEDEAKLSSSSTLNLSYGNFKLSSDTFYLYLANNLLFSKKLKVKTAPTISQIYPTSNIMFGVNTTFYVIVDDAVDGSVYYWDIDSISVGNSTDKKLNYIFGKSGTYKITITLKNGNYTNSKDFYINVVAPSDAEINGFYTNLVSKFDNAKATVKSLPNWYSDIVWTVLGMRNYEVELAQINDSINLSETQEEKMSIIRQLYALDIPISISESESYTNVTYILNSSNVDEDVVKNYLKIISGKSYNDSIVNWFYDNIKSTYSSKIISYTSTQSPSMTDLVRVYEININSSYNNKSYLVINKVDNLSFGENYGQKEHLGKYFIEIPAEKSKTIRLYTKDISEVSWFVSPDLNNIILSSNINDFCNYNDICDKDSGETFFNCQNDCLLTDGLIKYLIIIIVSLLVIYTIIQQWYSANYEKRLFNNTIQLQNLVSFIKASRTAGLSNSQIKESLLVEGWTDERVNYAFRKVKGKSVMPEIIPISKIKVLLKSSKNKDDNSQNSSLNSRNI